MEKSTLTKDNKAFEIQVKNLLEELKLTKDAGGDSVSKIAELTRDLRQTRENLSKTDQELTQVKQTLEARTS